MRSIAIFNNKGGVGKTLLSFHTACALAEMQHKTLLVDLDAQCNLTLFGFSPEELEDLWTIEEPFIDDFKNSKETISEQDFKKIIQSPRSIHFNLKPQEEGLSDIQISPPKNINPMLDIIPGRMTIHMYEERISNRWAEAYLGDAQAIRTISKIRSIVSEISKQQCYEYVIIDTSPSLGILNKVIISTSDAIVIPCMPDMFSLYGIKNIGRALKSWHQQFATLKGLLSDPKKEYLPKSFVKFAGFTIYNATKYQTTSNPWDLATAHYHFAQKIPEMIINSINSEFYKGISGEVLSEPIGGKAIMHRHNTLPNMAQMYRKPIWDVPNAPNLLQEHVGTIRGNKSQYEATKIGYHQFAENLIKRLDLMEIPR